MKTDTSILTQTGRDALARLALEAKNEETGDGPGTVKIHLNKICRTTSVLSRLQVALWAAKNF